MVRLVLEVDPGNWLGLSIEEQVEQTLAGQYRDPVAFSVNRVRFDRRYGRGPKILSLSRSHLVLPDSKPETPPRQDQETRDPVAPNGRAAGGTIAALGRNQLLAAGVGESARRPEPHERKNRGNRGRRGR